MAWIMAHYMDIAVALLAVDRVLITLFPNTTVFGAIANFLQNMGAK